MAVWECYSALFPEYAVECGFVGCALHDCGVADHVDEGVNPGTGLLHSISSLCLKQVAWVLSIKFQ